MLYLCAIRRGLAVDASWQGCSWGFCRSPLPHMNLHMQRCVQLLFQITASKQAFVPLTLSICSSQRSGHDTLAAMLYKVLVACWWACTELCCKQVCMTYMESPIWLSWQSCRCYIQTVSRYSICNCAGMLYHTTVCFADIASFPAANNTASVQVHGSLLNTHT